MKKIYFLLLLLFLFHDPSFSQDLYLIDSLTTALKIHTIKKSELGKNAPTTYDTLAANILEKLSKAYRTNNPDKSMDYANQCLILSEQTGYKKGIASAYNNIGIINYNKGEYLAALEFQNKALLLSKQIGDKYGVAESYNGIGNIYYSQGNYPEALRNHFASLKIKEDTGDENGIATSYNNIGNIYVRQRNYSESMKYYLLSKSISEKIGDKQGVANALLNIGNIYIQKGNFSETLKYYSACLEIRKEIGNKQGIAGALHNIGNIYGAQGKIPEALKYYLASLKINEELGDKATIANSLTNIGRMYIHIKKYNDASEYLNKALAISKEIGNLENIKHTYQDLAIMYNSQGNFKQALENYELFITFRDSIVNNENIKKITQQQMQYDFDKKVAIAKVEQQKKDVIVQQQLREQKIIRNSFIGGSILLTLLIVVLINRNKLKRTIEMEKMRSRLSRDLHDDIGSTLSSINILSSVAQSNLNQTDVEKTKVSLKKINERSQRLLDSMSDIIWNINPVNDTIEQVMSRMREYATTLLEAKNVDFTINFPEGRIDCKLSMELKNNMYLIFKEAVNNLSKYSDCTKSNLSLTLDAKSIHIKIEDNGTGFDQHEIKHRGGIDNMQQRAEDIGGTIKINSIIEKGTIIELTIPRYS